RWTKVYLDWMENIRDWCISRQIWWGHRIPVWYCMDCRSETSGKKGVIVSRTAPNSCPDCKGANIKQDEDVLDTWFSSWLWPFSTLGWPDKNGDLTYFYPTSSLVTAQEIIFFWVARMIMAGLEFMGDVPFREVYIHGTVRDDTGAKMSKSLGNIIDPLEIIDEFGSDALRFSIISITAAGQDVFLSKQKFELGRNFANKIWNASRFVFMSIDEKALSQGNEEEIFNRLFKQNLTLADKWILFRALKLSDEATDSLEKYRFNEAANNIYDFFWHEYCDWYLEIVKPRLKEETVQNILSLVLSRALRLLHPYMPFITEEIYQKLPNHDKSIMIAEWPKSSNIRKNVPASILSEEENITHEMNLIIEAITAIRNLRAEVNLNPRQTVHVVISCKDSEVARQVSQGEDYIKSLARVDNLEFGTTMVRPEGAMAAVTGELEIYLCLKGVVDIEAERGRLARQAEKLQGEWDAAQTRLANIEFINRAKPDAVEKVKARAAELEESIVKLKENLKHLG
ncbi:MAG: class I tRNA ligase family protein, partial [Candidatus Omnitrophica bacterium]|nr:class I tRNA ligase family protein [Candidatus Omnitrophota bacterium]